MLVEDRVSPVEGSAVSPLTRVTWVCLVCLFTVWMNCAVTQAQKSKTDLTSVDLSEASDSSSSVALQNALINPLGVGIPDTLQPIRDTTKGPWRAVCKLQILFPSGSVEATGVLVGKHHVLTAGHNIFDPRKGGWARDVKVFPGYNKGIARHGGSRSVKLMSMRGFTEDRDPGYDLGFVITKDDIGNATGWFGMSQTDGQDLRSTNLRIVGYPSEGDHDGETLEDTPCAVTRTTFHKVFYRTNTYEGLSGAPIFAQSKTYGNAESGGFVVGIHTTGDDTENSGPKIRREIWNWVMKSLATSNSTIAGLWNLQGNTLRITVNGSHVRAVYEKVINQLGPIRPGHVEFQGIIDGKTIVGRDTVFYGYSPVEIQCRIAGGMADVDVVLYVSPDERTMTGRISFMVPDQFCVYRAVSQELVFTKQ